jgi:hypothetical protein
MEDVGVFKAIWPILRPFGLHILRPLCLFDIFYGHLVYLMAIWYILWPFGIFYGHLVYFMLIWYIFPVLVSCTKENLATLLAEDSFWDGCQRGRVARGTTLSKREI